jgi:tetratricopeptide (TPR) repeat protein
MEYLNVRAWCRFQFLRDYEGTLQDLDQLRKLNGVLGFSTNGDYDMRIVEALCYRELGDSQTSLRLFHDYLTKKESGKESLGFGSYDYLHDGVTKLKAGKVREAMAAFDKQIAVYKQLPDTYYYYGIACRQLHEDKRALDYFKKANEFFNQGYSRLDPYTEPLDKVYPADIARALNPSLQK